ncbi:right-handed parallel beta-helix repeat-containing protein [Methylocystis heyeri]|uniref:Uncharacterized protein n=1 Tax=Methylocystis heyeri TaxID=391905 RepID=A0A6B8KH08_9HYPH|nr:right-handed parallel beta-helix repeat-containing protein [Methylocystis heyeri]QGM45763.1 hypothetical protein H2LOC_008640 [Methylocystis heyeri]
MFQFTARAALAATFTLLGFQAPAQAGSAIAAWVSGSGQDIAGCGPQASPCRTFQYVHDNILGSGGGDILVRDSGSFGPLSITKPVSVINDGVGTAGTGAPSGQVAISINAPGANVVLRGLSVDGVGGAYGGVGVVAVGNLTVKDSFIQNFTQFGVAFSENYVTVKFSMSNTTIQNIGVYGIALNNFGGSLQANISGSHIFNNGTGLFLDSVAPCQALITDTIISGNGTGIYVNGAGSMALLRRSAITWNGTGYKIINNGSIMSYQDNSIYGNATLSGTLQTIQSN